MITLMSYIYWIIESNKIEKMIAGTGDFEETIRRLLYVQERLINAKPDYSMTIGLDLVFIIWALLIFVLLKITLSSSEEKR